MSWRASSGARAWLLQRLTAVYIALFVPVFAYCLLSNFPLDFSAWRELVASPLMNAGLAFLFLSLFIHMWVGLRDVVMDYIHPDRIRFTVLILLAFMLCVLGFAVLRTLLMVGQ